MIPVYKAGILFYIRMIEIFKTNVENKQEVAVVIDLLRMYYQHAEINFDLEDCDRILRIKGEGFCVENVIKILANNGFECCLLA
ncbi:hypothetical protein Mucpa_1955 [Mucilaginibacter paludis DSM 18603]|uniref:Uncharacterized protein n=1 Tax=Mucilaginibacter paludis DSM 18603 TaxID=714943 RepID=H1YD41_9SPHI|nr:hypothetical protein Mucpa_1955 [Mucilaginibacter paludis DSM 18603]